MKKFLRGKRNDAIHSPGGRAQGGAGWSGRFPLPGQLIPLIVLFALAGAALFIARSHLVPETFGEHGHYRSAAVDEISRQDLVYAGYQACADCHDDITEVKRLGNHQSLSCEVCHGPAAAHVEAPDEHLPTIPRGRQMCILCHAYDPPRPSGFPQIIPELHNPGRACTSCHSPHEPVLPTAPEECSACHRKIASQKRISRHATLLCTECHTVPEDHWVAPGRVPALKPTARAFCARCHGEDSGSPRTIPRVDAEDHGRGYLCWDCHYPHQPEARP